MAQCPDCEDGKAMRMACYGGPPVEVWEDCETCGGEGTIPDRRAPSAAERAVERIKARCEQEMDADVFHAVGGRVLANIIATIINEEASRG